MNRYITPTSHATSPRSSQKLIMVLSLGMVFILLLSLPCAAQNESGSASYPRR